MRDAENRSCATDISQLARLELADGTHEGLLERGRVDVELEGHEVVGGGHGGDVRQRVVGAARVGAGRRPPAGGGLSVRLGLD